MGVKWSRINRVSDVAVRTDILQFEDLLEKDWHKDDRGNVFAHVDLPKSENGINVLINALFSGLGQSWRPILDKGSSKEVDVLKSYMDVYKNCSNLDMRIMIDSVENR